MKGLLGSELKGIAHHIGNDMAEGVWGNGLIASVVGKMREMDTGTQLLSVSYPV